MRHLTPRPASYSETKISLIAQEILSASGASDDFSLNIIDDRDVDFFSIPIYTTALKAIRDLAEKNGRAMRFFEDAAGTKTIIIDASSYTTPNRHSLQFGANTTNISREVDLADRVTRVYAVGGGDPPLTLANSRLARNVPYIDAPSYSPQNHFVGVYKNLDLANWENLIQEEKSPDFSGEYTNGLADGWSLIGAPAVSKNTNGRYIEYGSASQKIVASGTGKQGIECSITGAQDSPCVRWTHLYIESMNTEATIRVELSTENKITYNTIRGSEAISNRFVTITRLNAIFPSQAQNLKIYAEGGDATFYVDAVLVARGLEFIGFVIGSMPDQLYTEAQAFLSDREHAGISYSISSPSVMPRLYDKVQVNDSEIGAIGLRVEKVERDLLFPIRSKYSVGKPIRTPEEMAIIEGHKNTNQITESGHRQSRIAKKSALQSLRERREVVFFSGSPWEKLPNNRAAVRGGNVYVGGEDRYAVIDWTGAVVGHEKTVYVYIDELSGGIAQTLDAAVAANHPGLYKVDTPASTSTDFPVYTALFHPAQDFILESPNLKLSVTVSTITASWADVPKANAYVLQYRRSNQRDWTTVSPATSPHTIQNTTPNTSYIVQVKATSSGDLADSEWSQRPITTNPPQNFPDPDHASVRLDSDSVTITFDAYVSNFPADVRLYAQLLGTAGSENDPSTWGALSNEVELTRVAIGYYSRNISYPTNEGDVYSMSLRATADSYNEKTWYYWKVTE